MVFQRCTEQTTLVFALSLATSTGPSRLHGNPFFNVSLSAYQNCTKPGWGKEKVRKAAQKKPRSGRGNQTILPPRGPSMMQLSPAFDTLTKEGETVSSKTGLFFFIISSFVNERIKHPLQVFLWISRAILWQSHYSHCVCLHIWTKAISDLFC